MPYDLKAIASGGVPGGACDVAAGGAWGPGWARIAGWLAASNFHQAATFDIVAQDTTRGDIMTWLEDYCRTHESDGLDDAMVRLFRGPYPSRVTEGPIP